MKTKQLKTDDLACPSCKENSLEQSKHGLKCGACSLQFPNFDGLLWLFSSPNGALAEWKNQISYYCGKLDKEANSLEHLRANKESASLTAKRISQLEDGKRKQIRYIEDLLASFIQRNSAPPEFHEALKNKLPLGQNILSYYDNIFRDWVWGEKEIESSIASTEAMLDSCSPNWNDVVFLGSGAGRYPVEILKKFKPKNASFVDINPLLMQALNSIIKNENCKLVEFPINPIGVDEVAVDHNIRTDQAPIESKIRFCLADIRALPFQSRSFDIVFTPWLIDILPYSPAQTTEAINNLLPVGGTWIFNGPTSFSFHDPQLCLTKEELLSLVESKGFTIKSFKHASEPYMQSPNSCHGRVEKVLYFAAEKNKDCEISEEIAYLPDWIEDPSISVPLHAQIQSLTQIHAVPQFVLSRVDGKNSLEDIAKDLSSQFGLSEEESTKTLQNFFTTIFEQNLIFAK